VKENYFAV